MQLIEAIVFSHEKDEYCSTIGFSDSPLGDGKYLIIQTKEIYDQQDVSLGQDAPYFEFCGQEYAQYGGVEKITLLKSSQKIDFEFAEESPIGAFSKTVSIKLIDVDPSEVEVAINQHGLQLHLEQ